MAKFEQLDVDIIKTGLSASCVGKKILVYNHTSSSNDVAWEYAKSKENNGLAVFAEEQSKGRGRMGTKWFSNWGQSILCSILLLDCKCGLELLAITAAVATTEAIAKLSQRAARIKWPNDIMIDGKKVAGILLESRTTDSSSNYVIGIGINCHQDERFFQDNSFQMPAASIDISTGKTVDRNLLARQLLNSIDQWLAITKKDKDQVIIQWRQLSSQLGHRVTLCYDKRKFSGNCIGVDPAKGLILQLDNGAVRMFDAVHTTIVRQM